MYPLPLRLSLFVFIVLQAHVCPMGSTTLTLSVCLWAFILSGAHVCNSAPLTGCLDHADDIATHLDTHESGHNGQAADVCLARKWWHINVASGGLDG